MTALEAFNYSTRGGGSDFAKVISACAAAGPYCLIGGLAVNCYVEPMYTLDADIVLISERLPRLIAALEQQDFKIEVHEHLVNMRAPGSELRIRFTKDERYQSFPSRAEEREVLGIRVQVACLQDLAQGRLWAYSDPQRRLSKRKKDELDLIRLAETYPELKALYPPELAGQLELPYHPGSSIR